MQIVRKTTGATLTGQNSPELVFDLTVSESYANIATVTQHPVEEGANITDHIRIEPQKLTMTCMFTDAPIHTSGGIDRSKGLYASLLQLFNTKEVLTIVTGLKSLENMVITAITTPRNQGTEGAVYVDISFMEIRFAEALNITLPQRNIDATTNGASEVQLGKQTAKETTEEETKKGEAESSALYSFGAFLGVVE